MQTIGIIGLGLIGGSIGAGLKDAGWRVVGYDADQDHATIAVERGLVDRVTDSLEALLDVDRDITVIAVSPKATIEVLHRLEGDGVVMDVAGVKTPIVEAARHLPGFVATHPMAGRETSGPGAASGALFRGAAWVVTAAPSEVTQPIEDVIATLGARVVHMDPADHDAAVARISHVPQILAGALLAVAADADGALDLAAGSFRDLTRVAASQPLPWVELLRANADDILDAIGDLKDRLAVIEASMLTADDRLLTSLSQARERRRALSAPVAAVRVALADEPGEIAKVGHALEDSQVDVRDIQLRHAPHGGGGLLTISVRVGDEAPLTAALEAEGLLLVP